MFLIFRMVLAGLVLLAAPVQAQVFWSVTDDHGNQNWLLGTVHSEDPRLLEFRPELLDALQASERLALELVPDAGMLDALNQAMHYDSDRLEQVLGSELYAEVVDLLEQHYGMGEPAVRRMRPWAVAMTLSIPAPQTGLFMDLALSFRASGMGLEVMALETLDEQLGFLQGFDEDSQVEMVRQAVEDFDRMDDLFEALIGAYLDGDLDRLEALSRQEFDRMGSEIAEHFEQVGLVERNQHMVERALPYLREGGLVIAVGALHLPGEDGLIELLRTEGFAVEGVY